MSRILVIAVALLGLAGCVMGTAAVEWSPDGTRGVYGVLRADGPWPTADWFALTPAGEATPLADAVSPFEPLYPGFRPVAWADDSRTLYLTRVAHGATQLCRLRDGKTAVVADLGPCDTMRVCVGPGQRWAAVLTVPAGTLSSHRKADENARPAVTLSAVRLSDGAARQLTDRAGLAACFTGPDRLAYVRQGKQLWTAARGQLVEADLTAAPASDPDVLAAVLVDATAGLRATADGLTFIAGRQTFPTTELSESSTLPPTDLYRWTRATGTLAVAVPGVLHYDPSPDGTRLVFAGIRGKDTVAGIARSDGTGERLVPPDLWSVWAGPPMWRGNDRVTAAAGPGVKRPDGNGERTTFEVVEYAVAADGTVTPGRTLSAGWPEDRKPCLVTAYLKPTTMPATVPVTRPATRPATAPATSSAR